MKQLHDFLVFDPIKIDTKKNVNATANAITDHE